MTSGNPRQHSPDKILINMSMYAMINTSLHLIIDYNKKNHICCLSASVSVHTTPSGHASGELI